MGTAHLFLLLFLFPFVCSSRPSTKKELKETIIALLNETIDDPIDLRGDIRLVILTSVDEQRTTLSTLVQLKYGYNVNISFVDSEFANTPLEFSSSEVNIPKIMGCYNHAYAVVNEYLVTVSSGVVIVEKKVNATGYVSFAFDISVTHSCRMEFDSYPFDSHQCITCLAVNGQRFRSFKLSKDMEGLAVGAPTEWSISGEDVTTESGDDTRGDIRVLTVDIKYVIKRNPTFTVAMVLLISLLPSIGALYAEALYSEKFSSMLANASITTFAVGTVAGVVSKQLNLSSMCIFLLIETVLVFFHPFCQLLAEIFLEKWETWNKLKGHKDALERDKPVWPKSCFLFNKISLNFICKWSIWAIFTIGLIVSFLIILFR